MARKATDYIIWHSSATPPSMDVTASDIDKWHKARGWRGIGYHRVIQRDGTVEQGRGDMDIGAHCRGKNSVSYGICIIGGLSDSGGAEENFTLEQYKSIISEHMRAAYMFPDAKDVGHRDLASTQCPSFNVAEYLALNLT